MKLGRALAAALVLVVALAAGCSTGSSGSTGDGGNADGSASGTGGATGSSTGGTSGGSGGSQGSGGSGSGGRAASGGSLGTGGRAAGAGSGGSSSSTGGAGPQTCSIGLSVVSAISAYGEVEVGSNVKVRVQGTVRYPKVQQPPKWSWTINSPALMPLPKTDANDAGSLIEFIASEEGMYQIIATIANDPSCTPGSTKVTGVHSTPALNLRVTAAGLPVQEFRVNPASNPDMTVGLDPGAMYTIEPREVNQDTVMSAFLRVTTTTTTFDVEGSTARGALRTALIPALTYDLLVVPNDPTIAPELMTSSPEPWREPIVLGPGTQVTGKIVGPDQAPIANARLILKRGARPSTIGTSDGDGAFTLWTRPGGMSAVVVPPAGSGWPQATTSSSGVALPATAGSLSLVMRYASLPMGSLSITVRDLAGSKPVAGARVRVRSHADLPNVGTLSAHLADSCDPDSCDVDLAASGSVDLELTSDANGAAMFGSIPATDYDVQITPPSSVSGAALTSASVTVGTAGAKATVNLSPKVNLSGVLSPTPGAAGASITAIDKSPGALGGVVSTTADASGAFSLRVDPNRSYELLLQPDPSRASDPNHPLGRMIVGPVNVGKADQTMARTVLPNGLRFTGTVIKTTGERVGGATLQVFCVGSTARCPDPTLSLADGTANGDGSFSLIVPDPEALPMQ